jgi:C-terminal processing protease CtpA/Prc
MQCLGMLNLDSVGRLGDNKLFVLGTASAYEWPHIFRGVSYMTGVPVEFVADEQGGSDQRSFLDVGVPAVQLFSGVHRDYHRPTDTPDKIDAAGLVKVATVTRETIVYLAGRATPLSAAPGTQRGMAPARPEAAGGSRRVSLGTLPDFTYEGEGYKISDVMPGSPAAQAGLQAGDVIVRLGTTAIANLRAFANALKALQPGENIPLTFRRDMTEHTVRIQVVSR